MKKYTFAKRVGLLSTAALSTFALSEALGTAKAAEIDPSDTALAATEQYVPFDTTQVKGEVPSETAATEKPTEDEMTPQTPILSEAENDTSQTLNGDTPTQETANVDDALATESEEGDSQTVSVAAETSTPEVALYASETDDAEEDAYEMTVSEGTRIFEAGKGERKNDEGVYGYRIPALLQTDEGTLIATGDQRVNHSSDWGDINIVARRSTDGGQTWGDEQVIVDLPTNPKSLRRGVADSAYNIDSALVQDPETKRIFVLYDMMPEIRGIWELDTSKAPYSEIDGESYLNLYKDGEDAPYTLREEGIVYDPEGEVTDYRVVTETEAPYNALGDLYENEEKIGNIYFRTNNGSPFKIARVDYIWLSYSDDDGRTWSVPRDITPQVRADWMKFFGVGPGAGIALHTGEHAGRLIIPVYSTNQVAKDHLNGSQSSAVIYSDDHGETWHRSEAVNDGRILEDGTVLSAATMDNKEAENTEATVVQLNNGDVKMFMRNRSGHVAMATSKDGGATWEDHIETLDEIPDVYVQLAALQTMIDGREYLIIANAAGPDRTNGTVHLAEVNEDGSFNWVLHQQIQGGEYAYNSIAPIAEGRYGILFEHSGNTENTFNLDLRTIDITTTYQKETDEKQESSKSEEDKSSAVAEEGEKTNEKEENMTSFSTDKEAPASELEKNVSPSTQDKNEKEHAQLAAPAKSTKAVANKIESLLQESKREAQLEKEKSTQSQVPTKDRDSEEDNNKATDIKQHHSSGDNPQIDDQSETKGAPTLTTLDSTSEGVTQEKTEKKTVIDSSNELNHTENSEGEKRVPNTTLSLPSASEQAKDTAQTSLVTTVQASEKAEATSVNTAFTQPVQEQVTLPQTGLGTAGLGLGVTIAGLGSVLAIKKKH